MLETVVKQEIIFYVMGILAILAILTKAVSIFTARKMAKAASEIHKSNHKLMRLIKGKFEHASMVSDKVQNVEAFVRKYLYEYKVFGIRMQSFMELPKKFLWVVAILGVLAIFESYRLVGLEDLTLQYMQWTGIYVLILGFFAYVMEEDPVLEAAENYMVEYLENVCVYRYKKANVSAEKEKKESIIKEREKQMEIEKTEEEKKKAEQEMRIRAILEEFLA